MGSSIIYLKKYNKIKKITLRPNKKEVNSLWLDGNVLFFLIMGYFSLVLPHSKDSSLGETRYLGFFLMAFAIGMLYQRITVNLYEEIEIEKGRLHYIKYTPLFKRGLAFTRVSLDIDDILKVEKLASHPVGCAPRMRVPDYRIKIVSKKGDFVIFNCFYSIRDEGFVIKNQKNIALNRENEEEIDMLHKRLEDTILAEKGRLILEELKEQSIKIFSEDVEKRYDYFLKKIIKEEVIFMDKISNNIWGGRGVFYHSKWCDIENIEEVDFFKFIVEYLIPKNFSNESKIMYNGTDYKEVAWERLKEDINRIRLDENTDYNTTKFNYKVIKNNKKYKGQKISNMGITNALKGACRYQLFLCHLAYLFLLGGIFTIDGLFSKFILFISVLYLTRVYLQVFHITDELQVLEGRFLRYNKALKIKGLKLPLKHLNVPIDEIQKIEFKRKKDEKFYNKGNGFSELIVYKLILHCSGGKFEIFSLRAFKNLTGIFNFIDKNRLLTNEIENYVRDIEKLIILNKDEPIDRDTL